LSVIDRQTISLIPELAGQKALEHRQSMHKVCWRTDYPIYTQEQPAGSLQT